MKKLIITKVIFLVALLAFIVSLSSCSSGCQRRKRQYWKSHRYVEHQTPTKNNEKA